MRAPESLLLGAVIIFIYVCVIAGGRAFLTPLSIVPLGLAGSLLIGTICYTGAWQTLLSLPRLTKYVLVGIIALPAIQLIPLPPSIWAPLPGHELAASALAQAGASASWQPLSLVPALTTQTLMQAVWLIALLTAVLSLSRSATARLLDAMLLLVALHVMVGIVQVATKGSVGNFLSSSDGKYLIGFFANKNHSALFICFGAILAFIRLPARNTFRASQAWIACCAVLVLITLAIATTSRAGILLMLATLIGLTILLVPRSVLYRRSVLVGGIVIFAVCIALTLSFRSTQAVFGHFGDAGDDMRVAFWSWSLPMVGHFFPTGGGMGVFADAFANRERLAWVKPTFVNHVHNEYIELVIEGGAASVLLLLAFGFAVARRMRTIVSSYSPGADRAGIGAALIVLLCAAHSLVDYPLRRMGIAAVFFVALALMLRVQASGDHVAENGRGRRSSARV